MQMDLKMELSGMGSREIKAWNCKGIVTFQRFEELDGSALYIISFLIRLMEVVINKYEKSLLKSS